MLENAIIGYIRKSPIINHTKTYWKNAGIVIGTIIIGKSFSFIWKILLARIGSQAIGATELLLSVFTVLTMFSVLGFQTSTIRYISIALRKKRLDLTMPLILTACKITVAISIIIFSILSIFPGILELVLQKSFNALHIQQVIWALPFFVMIEMLLAYLVGKQKTFAYAVGKYVIQPILRLLILIIFLIVKLPAELIIPVHIISAGIISSCILMVISKPLLRYYKDRVSKQIVRKFVMYTLPMSGSLILFTVYGALDILLLGRFTDIQTVGRYAVIVLVAEIPSVTFAPFLNMFQSYLSAYHNNRKAGIQFTVVNILLFILAGSIVGFILYISRIFVFRTFFTHEYTQYLSYLGLLMLIRISEEAIVLPLRHLLDFYGYVRSTLFIMIVVMIVKLSVGLLTIPQWGVLGVIYMQAAAVAVHLLLTICFSVRLPVSNLNQKTYDI